MIFKRTSSLLVVALCFLMTVPLWAGNEGRLVGTIVDPDGNPIVDVQINVTGVGFDVTQERNTNKKGKFTLLILDATKDYLLHMEKDGFQTAIRRGLELTVGEYGVLTLGLRYAIGLILPIVALFFLVFAIIEDTGYLPRLAMLIDRGYLDYNARITNYWPEFGAGDNPPTTIADLMRHEAGLAKSSLSSHPADPSRSCRTARGGRSRRSDQTAPVIVVALVAVEGTKRAIYVAHVAVVDVSVDHVGHEIFGASPQP